ncbi:MAG: acetoacetate decarboxylase [Burkholderiaceae bacterium]|nr:acetoacetate decarboxylase [Burkholderiaceae bacterium]
MTEDEVRSNAFAMPMHNPAFPPGPYRFVDREYLVITYRTDPELLQKILPAPLKMTEPVVKYEFINMPDSTGFGHYCESGQVIPVTLDGVAGGYVHSMYLNDHPPIAAGRELWGFPKKLGEPELRVHKDTLIGTLDYSDFRVATGTMGYKHKTLDAAAVKKSMEEPCFLLKVIPHVDGTPRICELVQYSLTDVVIKGAWGGPGGLELNPHALAPVAALPVLEVLSAVHIMADLTLPYGKVVHDYLNLSK